MSSCADDWIGGPPTMVDDDGMTVINRPLNRAGMAEIAGALGARLRLAAAHRDPSALIGTHLPHAPDTHAGSKTS
jgi:hypothetical protein